MARLGFDATAVSPRGRGIARVSGAAAEALHAAGVDVVALVAAGVELAAPTRAVRTRPAVLWEQVGLRRAAREHDVVLTFTERLPVGARGRFVVWLFELPQRRLAQNRSAGPYQRGSDALTRLLWRRSLRAAAAVAAGSRATATELAAALPDIAARVEVVHPGLDPRFSAGPGANGDPYVFHLGSSDRRDDAEAVVRAFALARARLGRPLRLVVAGELGDRRSAFVGAEGVELRGRVSDEELVRLYRGAAAYLDASRFEGFGYQPLEAMACGAPFVGVRTTAVPEVVGDAGLLVAPGEVEALGAGLARVLEDPRLAGELRQRGTERASEFTWERAAGRLADLVEAAAP